MLHCLGSRPKSFIKWEQGENIPLGTKLAPALFLWFPPRGRGGKTLSSEGQLGATSINRMGSLWPGVDAPGGKTGCAKGSGSWAPVLDLEGTYPATLVQGWIWVNQIEFSAPGTVP